MMPSCDQIGVPIHFHSSTTSGSASLMSSRVLLRVFPRQSPSSAILFEMSSDADWPWLAPDFFMLQNLRRPLFRLGRSGGGHVHGKNKSLPVAADVPEVSTEGSGQFEQQLRRARAERRRGRDLDRHHQQLIGLQVQAAEKKLLAV